MSDWTVRIYFAKTAAASRVSKVQNERLALDWKVIERRTGATLVATQLVRRRTASSALLSAARAVEWIRNMAEEDIQPISVSMHQDGEPEQIPELVTLAEIAVQLGVSRQRVQQLSRQPWFPSPVARTKSGPIYTLADAQQMQREREAKLGRDYTRKQLVDAIKGQE
ncbi:hypothetical protein K7640_13680 [Micromonospora sp. PLK6-60]|uniref:hypothetical protein n=1 Tax=Micromonospora sp. PLK6-60 TaxID=2873383 RepID=UPI001CA66306|nr:hypothetical protein [Micromonospora sp. PLK6-60]MBY8872886.1 hypothetical protein [Micromonospora sp. PLK6-60]